MTKPKRSSALDTVRICCAVLDDKKAGDVKVLDVGEQSSITDYLILATATSEPHLRALRVELEKALDASGARIVGMEMAQESGWVVVDIFDVMVHLFLGSVRDHYNLERLWRDASELPLSRVLKKPAAKKPTRTKAGSASARRKK